jgi:hypothetical protein
MSQLSLLQIEDTSVLNAYDALLKDHSWDNLVSCANNLEQEVNNESVFKKLGYSSFKEFLESLGKIKNDYIYAIKLVWWHRLVWIEKDLKWLQRQQFKESRFTLKFPFICMNKKTGQLMTRHRELNKAKAAWELAKFQYGNNICFTDMERFIEGSSNPYSEALEKRIEWLEKDLANARKDVLSFLGYKANNLDIPPKYAEIYAIALRSNMSAMQTRLFTDILIMEDYYSACRYLDQFELIAF